MESRRFEIRQTHRAGNCVQVTIPSKLCREVGLQIGDKLYIYLVGGVICLKKFDEGGFTPEVIAVRSQESGVGSRE